MLCFSSVHDAITSKHTPQYVRPDSELGRSGYHAENRAAQVASTAHLAPEGAVLGCH